jgi:integrase/recombinase XerD
LAERVLSEESVQQLLVADAGQRDSILLTVLYLGGLRVSEATGLRWRNLHSHGDAGQISVFGKNGKTRAVTLPPQLWTVLTSLRGSAGSEDPVFRSRGGKSLDRGRVRVIMRRVAEQAGITSPVSPHWLRHAHASHALDHGAPIHLVQTTLGHASVSTTSSYLHARPGDSSARFLSVASSAARPPVQEQKATRTAAVAPQARRVALGGGKLGEKASRARKTAQKR